MNKNTLKIFSFVVGILLCVIALFDLISTLISMGKMFQAMGSINDGKYTAYYILQLILSFASIALFAIVGAFIINSYVKKTNEESFMEYPAIIFFGIKVIQSFVFMCFYGVSYGDVWVRLILSVAGLVLLILVRLSQIEKNQKDILRLVGIGIGFVLAVVGLSGSSDIGIVTSLCLTALFVILFLYYLFKMLIKDESNETVTNNVQ
jgi:hypothetical protein